MIEIRNQIQSLLTAYSSRVYYQHASDTAAFPHIVYNFLPSFTEGDLEVLPLDVDVWDNASVTTVLETISNNIWKGLNKTYFQNEKVQFSIYAESRFPELDEDDINIKRRKMTFQVRYFDKELYN